MKTPGAMTNFSERAEQAATKILDRLHRYFKTRHVPVPADAKEFSHLDLASYETFQTEMEALGYRYLGDMESPALAQADTGYVRTMLRGVLAPDGSILAMHAQIRQRLGKRLSLLAKGLLRLQFAEAPRNFVQSRTGIRHFEAATEFDDGLILLTSASSSSGTFPSSASIERKHFPLGVPNSIMLDYHRERVAALLREGRLVRPIRSVEDWVQAAERMQAATDAYYLSNEWRADVLRFIRSLPVGNTRFGEAVVAEAARLLYQPDAK